MPAGRWGRGCGGSARIDPRGSPKQAHGCRGGFFHRRRPATTDAYMTSYNVSMTTRRTTILADADLLDRLDRFARRTRTTKTALIAAALEAWLGANTEASDLPFLAVGR